MAIKQVGIVGSGIMGSGIAEVAAASGHEVVLRSRSQATADAMVAGLEKSLNRQIEKGKRSEAERDQILSRVSASTDLRALADVDLVIESVVEDLTIKKHLFTELDRICKEETIIATNTSTLPVVDLAMETGRPDRVCGIHFFNPAPVMSLVEVVRPITASEETIEAALTFAQECGKEPVAVKDQAGFIVNALLFPYLNNAIRIFEQGVATKEGIDTAMKGGLRVSDGTVRPPRPRRSGHLPRHPRRPLCRVPRPQLRRRPPPSPDGGRRDPRPKVRPRLLRVPEIGWSC